jgi:hypothetical protein
MQFVDAQIWAKGSLDASAYNTFLRGASLGIPSDEVMHIVGARIQEAGYVFPKGKLGRQQKAAIAYVAYVSQDIVDTPALCTCCKPELTWP